jgi:hypothetical protein
MTEMLKIIDMEGNKCVVVATTPTAAVFFSKYGFESVKKFDHSPHPTNIMVRAARPTVPGTNGDSTPPVATTSTSSAAAPTSRGWASKPHSSQLPGRWMMAGSNRLPAVSINLNPISTATSDTTNTDEYDSDLELDDFDE